MRIWQVPACKIKSTSTCILECGTPSWACFCLKPPLTYLPILISVVMALYSVDSFISGNILKTKNCVHWTLINFTHAVLDLLLVKMFAHYPLHSWFGWASTVLSLLRFYFGTMPNQPQMFLILYFAQISAYVLPKIGQNITQIKAFYVHFLRLSLQILPEQIQKYGDLSI